MSIYLFEMMIFASSTCVYIKASDLLFLFVGQVIVVICISMVVYVLVERPFRKVSDIVVVYK